MKDVDLIKANEVATFPFFFKILEAQSFSSLSLIYSSMIARSTFFWIDQLLDCIMGLFPYIQYITICKTCYEHNGIM